MDEGGDGRVRGAPGVERDRMRMREGCSSAVTIEDRYVWSYKRSSWLKKEERRNTVSPFGPKGRTPRPRSSDHLPRILFFPSTPTPPAEHASQASRPPARSRRTTLLSHHPPALPCRLAVPRAMAVGRRARQVVPPLPFAFPLLLLTRDTRCGVIPAWLPRLYDLLADCS